MSSPRGLPPLAADAAPEFADAQACKAWLEHVPLANVAAAQHQLLAQLEVFNRFPASAAVRLAALEVLREAVNFVQIEQAKRFTNRALPMAEAEAAVFDDTIALWEQMRLGYLRCLEAAVGGDAALRAQAGLVCQRALAYCGLKMFHHYRAYREVPARDWRALHETYARAETLGAAEEPVKDFLNRDVTDTSPRVAYARAVLMGMCSPNELTQRQLTFIAYLLERWAAKLMVAAQPGEDLPPLVADLAGERCPERNDEAPAAAEGLRYLDARRLSKSLRNRIALLRKGESPAKLSLGEDCVQPTCEQLLVFLYRQWCKPRAARPERRPVSNVAQASNELAALHYYVSGKSFRQPAGGPAPTVLTRQQKEEIAAFGRLSNRADDPSSAGGFLLEEWKLEEESVQGLKIVRGGAVPGRRYAHGQLIGVRPADAKAFILGQVRWLVQGEEGELHAGVRVLPGVPAAVAVRPTGVNALNEPFAQALALAAVPALNSAATLVLPLGWYKPKRVLELQGEGTSKIQLVELIERGQDFERATYAPAP